MTAVGWPELTRLSGEYELPSTIDLRDCSGSHERLQVHEWLRSTPARHDALAVWHGHNVLARLFTGPDAGFNLEREKQGMQQLAALNLPRPVLLKEGRTPTFNAWLLYEIAGDVQSLLTAWTAVASQPPLTDAQQALLAEALGALGLLHGKGLWPSEPEFRHFVRHQGQVCLIDAGVLHGESVGTPLRQDRVLENLGQFLAQLPARFDPWFEQLLTFYLQANDAHALPLAAIHRRVARARERQIRQHLPRYRRNSQVCHLLRDGGMRQAVLRSEEARLRPILADPYAAFCSGTPCAAGGEALAVRLETATRPVRMICYPAPTGWRQFHTSPAWRAWIGGQRCYLLGETTRRPLAVLENRHFGRLGVSCLITEWDT